jgi:hypothetical protein
MVVDANILELWPTIGCSYLGAVEKKDADPAVEVRTIHDLSFPSSDSVNSAYVAESIPKVYYKGFSEEWL